MLISKSNMKFPTHTHEVQALSSSAHMLIQEVQTHPALVVQQSLLQ